MDEQTLWIVAILGAGTLLGTFWRMRGGFGPMNLRAVGIVLIAALASLLAVGKSENLTAAMGILGAIAGYLFGARSSAAEEAAAGSTTGVNAQGAQVSGNAKIAGRDINETINNIERMLGEVQGLANATINNLEVLHRKKASSLVRRRREAVRWEASDREVLEQLQRISRSNDNDWTQRWIDICLDQHDCLAAIRDAVDRNQRLGWRATEADFDNTRDGVHINLTFEREVELLPAAA